jgi:hypothetical protein
MKRVLIYDIETMLEIFLIVIYIPAEKRWVEFEISKDTNGLDKFIRFTEKYAEFYWVGYNNLRFDAQVIEWIIRNARDWNDLNRLEIAAMICQKGQDTIHDSNYDVFPEYRESDLTLKQIDLFRIHHFDNRNRMVSLKRLEFEMDLENIEEMPIKYNKVGLTDEDLENTRYYCKNDVRATYKFYKITIGDTDHPLYKGNNQIQLREDIDKEFGIHCMNYSDSKIGDEIIKKYYCEESKIDISDIKQKGTFRKYIAIRNCMAKYISFKTPQLQEFQESIKWTLLAQDAEFQKEIHFYGQVYTFAKGGLHTVNTPKIFEAKEDYQIIDWDVSSYYPAIIINNGKFPNHLGKAFLVGYQKMFNRRLELKPFAKKDKRIKGIVGALKLAVNSVYGKSSDIQSWLFDKQITLFTCITGELSLMMLIEAYELEGIKVISANTDGVTVMIHKDKIDKMLEINQWWMDLTSYELERTDYSKIVFSTVNDYIAITTNGEIKRKGDFVVDFELYKNKSARVVPIALGNYFVDGTAVANTINSHGNIYDFAMRQKSSKDFHYEGIQRGVAPIITTEKELLENGWIGYHGNSWIKQEWITDRKPYDRMAMSFEQAIKIVNDEFRYAHSSKTIYNKLIRYYISNKGEKILKVKNPECMTNAVKVAQVDAGNWVAQVVNKLPKDHPLENINRKYYIEKANRIISNILYEGKKHKEEHQDQLKLF